MTQNASKEETCVMYEASDAHAPQDDFNLAKQALLNIKRIVDSGPGSGESLENMLKSLRDTLDQADLQRLLLEGEGEHGE
mmetsp:Transcript_3154/g.5078  ORF Transcript_3154/g.5078 Transcript_3154/m.5078 type:complete len:80 (+) Transcript_3154:38-277(+)